jgi:hypothetical protein
MSGLDQTTPWAAKPFIAGSAPLRGAHVMSTQKSATQWRAPSKDALRVQGSANCANGANRQTH